MRKRVILDCDDVLYACNGYACNCLNAEYGTAYSINDIDSWGITGKFIDKRMKYFTMPEFIRHMPLMCGAKEFVKELSDNAKIIIATSVATSCASERIESLKENFPEIKPENVIISNRKDVLFGDFMLDDAIHHIKSAVHVKHPVLLLKPWNIKEKEDVLSVSDYRQFLKLFNNMQE